MGVIKQIRIVEAKVIEERKIWPHLCLLFEFVRHFIILALISQQQLSIRGSFCSRQCVAYMYFKVDLSISVLESTDNFSSPYRIIGSNSAFERFDKPYGCYVAFANDDVIGAL